MVVIVHKLGDGIVVTSRHHAGWRFLLRNCRLVSMNSKRVIPHALHFFSYVRLSSVFGGKLPYHRPSVPFPSTLPALKAYNHLLVLSHADALPLDDLQVLQPAKHIVLDPEDGLHAEFGSFFDGERLGLEFLNGTGRVQVNDDVGASFDFESQGLNHAAALIGGVHGERGRVRDTEGGLPTVEGFIVLVWWIAVSCVLARSSSHTWQWNLGNETYESETILILD